MITSIYLSGAIRTVSHHKASYWRSIAAKIWQEGGPKYTVRNPMRHNFTNDSPAAEVVENDLADIKEVDALFVNWDSNAVATGTAMEMVYAKLWNKPVFLWCHDKEISVWAQYHATVICKEESIRKALEQLRAF